MLSNSTKYALKSVLYLSLKSDKDRKIHGREIAAAIKAPAQYVSKILQILSRQEFISSMKGRHGGFYLSEDNRTKKLIDIIIAIDGEQRIHSCALDLEKCNLNQPCPIHDVIYPTKSKLIEFFQSETIQSFADKYEKESAFIKV